MSEKNKTAIICMGGGMRSAHGAGFLYALGSKLGITSPDIVIGTSGNAGNSLYYVAGQYEFLKQVWSGVLSTPKFISLLRFYRIMDIDYLVDEVLKKQLPLDVMRLKLSRCNYQIPITDIETGRPKYICKEDGGDVYELLRAAKAAPFIFGKTVLFGGRTYEDGEFGPTMLDHVEHALNMGANKILIVDNTSRWKGFTKIAVKLYSLRFSKNLRDAVIRDINERSICLVATEATILCVHPAKLPAGLLTINKKKLIDTFEHGTKDALALEADLRSLFNVNV